MDLRRNVDSSDNKESPSKLNVQRHRRCQMWNTVHLGVQVPRRESLKITGEKYSPLNLSLSISLLDNGIIDVN